MLAALLVLISRHLLITQHQKRTEHVLTAHQTVNHVAVLDVHLASLGFCLIPQIKTVLVQELFQDQHAMLVTQLRIGQDLHVPLVQVSIIIVQLVIF